MFWNDVISTVWTSILISLYTSSSAAGSVCYKGFWSWLETNLSRSTTTKYKDHRYNNEISLRWSTLRFQEWIRWCNSIQCGVNSSTLYNPSDKCADVLGVLWNVTNAYVFVETSWAKIYSNCIQVISEYMHWTVKWTQQLTQIEYTTLYVGWNV